tara:strand:+ start:810 stop:1643 length:834 start_codon:yes stop_codon:yes gene_type:complete
MAEEQTQVATEDTSSDVTQTEEKPLDAQVDWKESLPEDLKSDPSLLTVKDVPGLAKSYIHAQKMIGADKIALPGKNASEEEWDAVYNKLGKPEEAKTYEEDFGDLPIPEENVKNFKDAAHKLGLNQTQFKGLTTWYKDLIKTQVEDINVDADTKRAESEAALRKEFGKTYDAKLKSSQRVFQTYGDTKFLDVELKDGTKLGDHPTFIKLMSNIADTISEDKIATGEKGSEFFTPAEAKRKIAELTTTGSPYWNRKDPGHVDAVKEVADMQEMVHPEE